MSLRVAVLEGQLLQLFLDGVQPKKPRQRSEDLQYILGLSCLKWMLYMLSV